MEQTNTFLAPPGRIDRWLSRFIKTNLKYWWVFVGLSILIAVVGTHFALRVRLNSDLESLLPKNAPSVVNMNKIKKKAGGSHDLRLILYGGSLEKRLEAAEAFSHFVSEKYPDFARSLQFKTPKRFLQENKFKFIPGESLDAILKRIERERKANAAITDPLGLEATIEKEESNSTETIPDAQSAHEHPQVTQTGNEDEELDSAKEMLQKLKDMRLYYQTEAGDYLAIRILPVIESLSIEKNRALVKRFQEILHEFGFNRIDPQIRYEIYGSIPSHINRFDSIANDVRFGVWGVLLILLIVAVYFRSLWALVTTVPPLAVGLALGMGVVGLVERNLNSIAIFLVLVVFGVGIEFGIHLWARMLEERRRKPMPVALDRTWRTTGRATLTSSTALLCGFALLTVSTFQGFAQFGRVAIILVLASAGSFVLFMPSWIILVEKLRGESKPWKASIAQLLLEHAKSLWWPVKWIISLRLISAALFVGGLVMSALYFRFDYGFAEAINTRVMTPARLAMSEIFTERLQPNALAVFKTEAEAASFVDYHRVHKAEFPDIPLVSGLSTFLPVDQPTRIEKLQQISDELEDAWIEKFKDEIIREALREIKLSAYDLKPHQLNDIPSETREPFIASDGSGDHLVYLFDIGGEADGRKAMRFSAAVDRLVSESGAQAVVSGQQIIFADIVSRVIHEGPWLVIGMFILVFLICWIDFRNVRHALITMAPVLAGFSMLGLALVLEGTQINFFNMVALASLGAMVVDNSIHLLHRFFELSDAQVEESEREATLSVGPTVLACTLTSICGYGGMALAVHNGIASLGWVAIVGLSCCFVSAVIFFPVWLRWIYPKPQ